MAARSTIWATSYLDQGKYTEAEALLRRGLAIYEKAFGPEHPGVAALLTNLANVDKRQDRNTDAEQLLRRAVTIQEKALGPDPELAATLNILGLLYSNQQILARPNPSLNALAIKEKVLGANNPGTAIVLDNLAGLYGQQRRQRERARLFAQGHSLRHCPRERRGNRRGI